MSYRSLREYRALRGDHRSVVAAGRLDRAPLGRVVHVHDAEAFGVAERPLVVIEQGPGVIAADIRALLHRIMGRAEVLTVVFDAQRIFDLAVDRVRRVVERGTVLRY